MGQAIPLIEFFHSNEITLKKLSDLEIESVIICCQLPISINTVLPALISYIIDDIIAMRSPRIRHSRHKGP
jgi:hypothetical protein